MAVVSLTAGRVLSALFLLGRTVHALAGAISVGRSSSKQWEDTGEGGCLRCTATGPSPPGLLKVVPSTRMRCRAVLRVHRGAPGAAAGLQHRHALPLAFTGSKGIPHPLQPGNHPHVLGAGSKAVRPPAPLLAFPRPPHQVDGLPASPGWLPEELHGRRWKFVGNIIPWGELSCPSLCLLTDTLTHSPKACRCVPAPSPPLPQVLLPGRLRSAAAWLPALPCLALSLTLLGSSLSQQLLLPDHHIPAAALGWVSQEFSSLFSRHRSCFTFAFPLSQAPAIEQRCPDKCLIPCAPAAPTHPPSCTL